MQLTIVAFVSLSCLALLDCGRRSPILEDDLDAGQLKTIPSVEAFANAPIIVVASVAEVRPAGPARPAKRLRDVLLDPIEILILPEHTLRGSVGGSADVRVYAFRYSTENVRALGQPAFDPLPGQRRIFFLRRESFQLRVIHDVLDYSIRVRSGKHPNIDPALLSQPGRAIAWLLLTVGEGCETEDFALHLPEYTYVARVLSSEAEMRSLLDGLAAASDPRIRREAVTLRQALDADRAAPHG